MTIRCNDKELRRFKRVAAHHSMGVATLIRMLVKKEALAIKKSKATLTNASAPGWIEDTP